MAVSRLRSLYISTYIHTHNRHARQQAETSISNRAVWKQRGTGTGTGIYLLGLLPT